MSATTSPGSRAAEHVVFGAGPVGLHLVDALLARGVSRGAIRVVNRDGSAAVPDGVQVVGGDAHDAAFTTAVAHGAKVVYNALNPPYHRWAAEFPDLQANLVRAAEAAGARLTVLENVYAYGAPSHHDGTPFTEDTPFKFHTRKGAVRAAMHRDLMAAHDAGRVQVAVGRASDYYGPRAGVQSPLGAQAVTAALTNDKARVLGDPDQPHTYTYLPDIGRGLAVLGEYPDAVGKVWHLPNDPVVQTTRQLLDTLYRLAGHGPARLKRTPKFVLEVVGLREKAAGELVEMLYEYHQPFIVDSTRITDKLGLTATPLLDGLTATLRSYR